MTDISEHYSGQESPNPQRWKQKHNPEANPVLETKVVDREETVQEADAPLSGGDVGYVLKQTLSELY